MLGFESIATGDFKKKLKQQQYHWRLRHFSISFSGSLDDSSAPWSGNRWFLLEPEVVDLTCVDEWDGV